MSEQPISRWSAESTILVIRAMIRPFLRIAGVGLALVLCVGAARAGSLIEFPSFEQRAYPSHLLGYLTRPDGARPFPAVVVLHGCPGFFAGYAEIADQLKSWGYVALAVDSLGSRELGPRCGMDLPPFQAADAYAALKYLSQDASVDAERIAVLGYSMGGESALVTVERRLIDPAFPEKFAAAIVYYPWCGGHSAMVDAPTLILIGAQDNVVSAASCREMVAQPHEGGAPIDLIVYPGAHHNFNFRVLTGPRYPNRWIEYNEGAAQDAEEKIRAFLAANLGKAPLDKPAPQ
jgi:dienelactone hydrolase